jgi:hypothetical protein
MLFRLGLPGLSISGQGIDPNLETFAMNNYTAYVNMARALRKIESNADGLKFSEEIVQISSGPSRWRSRPPKLFPTSTAIAPEKKPGSTSNGSIALRQA